MINESTTPLYLYNTSNFTHPIVSQASLQISLGNCVAVYPSLCFQTGFIPLFLVVAGVVCHALIPFRSRSQSGIHIYERATVEKGGKGNEEGAGGQIFASHVSTLYRPVDTSASGHFYRQYCLDIKRQPSIQPSDARIIQAAFEHLEFRNNPGSPVSSFLLCCYFACFPEFRSSLLLSLAQPKHRR